MASTHEPDQLLEPSNLLEPIDLTDKAPIDRIDESVSLDRPATPQSRFSRATSSAPRRRGGEPRSSLKPVLMVAGALACFGAGTAVPQLQTLLPSWASHWGVLDTASGPSASVDQPAKSDALKSAKPQAAVPVSGPANSGAAQPASGMQTPAASSAEQIPSTVAQAAQSESAPAEHVVNCAAPCNQQPCPKNDANCLEGGAVSPPQVSTKPDSSPDQTRESKTGEATIPLRDATNSPRGRTQRRERPAAKRSNLLAATNMRRSARRQIGPLSPDARLGAPVNRVATKIRGQHRPGVASGVQMNTSHPQIPLPVGQIAKRTVQQTDGENATRTIISRRVLRSAV